MKLASLHPLFVEELRDLYSAENQLLKALPKMAKAADSKQLKAGFQKHLQETKTQVERLESIFKELKEKPTGKTCKAMQGLIAEGDEVMSEDMLPEVMDAALIAAAQRVEHYEIAGYGCVQTWAELMGHKRIARLLQQTLNEEGKTDKALTTLSKKINIDAGEAESKPRNKARARKHGKPFGTKILEAVGLVT